jgi:hypothetical protein
MTSGLTALIVSAGLMQIFKIGRPTIGRDSLFN